MISARLEAKNLRIWLFCITLFLIGVIVCAPFLGLVDDKLLYSAFPFLDFGLVLSGSLFGHEIPSVVADNFSFAVSLACIILALSLFMHLIYVIVLNIFRVQRAHAASVLRKTGYSKDYFDILENKRRKLAKKPIGPTNDLCLAKEYCDGRKYESAFEILRNINIDDFDLKDATKYYAIYAYVFTLTGDLKNAHFALELDEPFIERQHGSIEADFSKALLAYAEHDFDTAKAKFKALLKTKNIELRVWSGMYLALIYLRLHNKDKARKLAVAISGYKKSPRQSEDMLKLLSKIEAAYALEAEEAAEQTREEFSITN